tara:strand:- start:666 stop:2012 length:1347 start_codon:yes stop_codon:yes gene_type:complete
MKNTFYISCPIDTYSGYGSRSRDFVKALVELDRFDIKILPQRWGNCAWGFISEHEEEWGFLKPFLLDTNNLTEQPDIWCQITVPNEFQKVGKFNIGLTAGIETTHCAPQWLEGLNRMDLNLVSSEHSKKVFETTVFDHKDKNGNLVGQIKLEKPVKVLLEGALTDLYKPLKRSELTYKKLYNDINSIPEDFAFLFMGHWMQGNVGEDRKNLGMLIKIFYEKYKSKKNPPALILKTSITNASLMGRTEILNRLNAIKKSVDSTKLPNVYILHGDLNNKEINELYNHPKVKAMVSLTKGEGFGRPLLEFSLTNKPIIASNWSGQLDFLNPEFCALVDGSLKPIDKSAVIKDMLIPESQWFSPEPTNVSSALTSVTDNYKDWKVKAKRQGYYSRSNFSFDVMREVLGDILKESLPTIAKQVPLSLPKLKKINDNKETNKLPKLKLPKLKKV